MATKKAALGRGLRALLPSEDQEQQAPESDSPEGISKSRLYQFEDRVRLMGRVADIEVENVRPNPYQPRQDFKEKALDELAASIGQLGIIQPITVRALGDGQFEIISGERRLRAARRAGLSRVPAYVREADSEAMLEMALVENVQREELNPIEEALGYQRLLDECNLTQAQVAEKVGKGRATIANMLRLLKLPPRVQAALRDRDVAIGHARALITVDDEEAQAALLQETIEDELSVRDVEERVRQWHERQEAAEQEDKEEREPDLFEEQKPDREELQVRAMTDRLRSRYSTQVQIKRKADGSGKIQVNFYSAEDLERVMDLLMGE